MTEPVQYHLQPPFFISSRLTPAINVGDATLHMHAAAIDTEDAHDPHVVWEYTIEGPTVNYTGSDLTTPYLGPATVAHQLRNAMSTLLGHLSHQTDGDTDETSLSDPVYEWARRNSTQIATMAELVDNTPERPMPSPVAWWAITHDPYQTPYGRWCAGQATAHADRLAALAARRGPAPGLVPRDERWHDTALAWYTLLTNQPAPEPAAPVCTVADRDVILAWLRGPAPDSSHASMADHLRLADAGIEWRRIPVLVDEAQVAGLFGVAGHTIHAYSIIDERTELIAHLLTITTPDGANLATTRIPVGLLGRWNSRPYDVSDLLQRYATHVDRALAPPPASADRAPPDRARPFPPLEPTPNTAAVDPPPTTPTSGHGHHR